MALINVNAGTTSRMLSIMIYDSTSTSGAGLTGLLYNSAGLTWYYHRDNAAAASNVTLATMTVGTWATGGFKEISSANMPGQYQIGIPDAAIAAGAKQVTMTLKGATNMVPVHIFLQLDNSDQVARQTVDSTYPSTSIGKRLSQMMDADGTATGGAAGTITLAASASSSDDYYNNQLIAITTGTGAGQVRYIQDYVGSTKVATVSRNWVTNPDATSGYIFVPAGELDRICESAGSYNAQQILSILLSATAGTSPSSGVFKTPNDASTRISGSVTSGGVRSAITITPST